VELRYAMVAEIHGNSPVTRPIDGGHLAMAGKLFPYVNQSGGGVMHTMVRRIWVTWISNFFLRALSTSIGGGSYLSQYKTRPQTHAQPRTDSRSDGTYWYAYREHRATRRPPLRGSIRRQALPVRAMRPCVATALAYGAGAALATDHRRLAS
jgi:hypothetical protein